MSTTHKRKRSTKVPPPSLGVLEFSSALSGEDPLLVLKKLRQFVSVVQYERRLALFPSSYGAGDEDGNDGGGDEVEGNDAPDDDGGRDDDGESILSFDDDDDHAGPFAKHRKLDSGVSAADKKTPAWKLDKNNYRVPFVGTSVAKGATGSVTPHTWPTGFLAAYMKHSSGVELITNEYIGASPPDGGIHKNLCKEESEEFGLKDGGKRKKKGGARAGGQTRGKILSMALQSNYWMALSEWILGYVSMRKLKEELSWENDGIVDRGALVSNNSNDIESGKSDKCAIPPSIMTILMKQRLPEWIDAIHNYTRKQYQRAQQRQKEREQQKKQNRQKQQQQQQNTKKQPKEDIDLIKEIQQQELLEFDMKQRQPPKQQRREETLLLAAMGNMIALCHLSTGTAREVLRRVTAATEAGTVKTSNGTRSQNAKGSKFAGGKRAAAGGGTFDGTTWMIQILKQGHISDTSPLSLKPHAECLRLVCTLLETKDYTILTRMTEVPGWVLKKGGGKNKGYSFGGGGPTSSNLGLAYIALRYGIQSLFQLSKRRGQDNDGGDNNDDTQQKYDAYARFTSRFLKDIREIILPPPFDSEDAGDGDGAGGNKKGFVLGIGATAHLLSGEVLNNLTKLAVLAPPNVQSIQDTMNGDDAYGHDLDPLETTAIEARRLLYLLLIDTNRSPFLYHSTNRGGQSIKSEEQTTVHLSQLSTALHLMLSDQGYNPTMKHFLGLCLKTTPELVPHFFCRLKLLDPAKLTYRSFAALTFVEGVIRESPAFLLPTNSLTTEKMLSAVIPSCVTKALLGKVIQSRSALLVSSGLKLIITLLRRARDCMSFLETTEGGTNYSPLVKRQNNAIAERTLQHLPEVSLLFSIPSRFDSFLARHQSDASIRAHAVVVLQMCAAIQCYVRLDPSLTMKMKFDWTKLVPDEFCSAEPLLQHRVLHTLLEILRQSNVTFSTKMMPNVLGVLVSTTIPEVHTMARKLALVLMGREIFPHRGLESSSSDNNETMQCQAYESSLWVDGISSDIIQELITMCENSRQQRIQHKIMVFQAWASFSMGYPMPQLCVSFLLSSSVSQLLGPGSNSFSEKMSLLLVQTATKMLLFQADPKPLAAILVFSTHGSIPANKRTTALYHAAKSILHNSPTANACVKSLSSNVFLSKSRIVSIVEMANKKSEVTGLDKTHYIGPVGMRQCWNMMKSSTDQNGALTSLFRRIIIGILETRDEVSQVLPVFCAMVNSNSSKPVEMESTMVLLLSAARSKRVRFEAKTLMNQHDNAKQYSMSMGLLSELLQCSLVPENDDGNKFISHVSKCCASALRSNKKAHTSHLRDFLLTVLLHAMPSDENSKRPSSFPSGVIFDLWALVADNLTTELAVSFCLRVEACLASYFAAMDGQRTWAVYQRISSLPPQVFIDLCMNTLLKRVEFGYSGGFTLLSSILEYDCSTFSCISRLFGGIDSDTNMEKMWDQGYLDQVAAVFVLQASKQKDSNKILASEQFQEAGIIIAKRFLTLLIKKSQVPYNIAPGVILDVVGVLFTNQCILPDFYQDLLEVFRCLQNRSIVLAMGLEIQMLKLAICAEASLMDQESNLLLTKAFLRCCKLLPKQMKKMLRTKKESESLLVESLAHLCSTLIKSMHSFDVKSSHVIDNCIVACLKYGMMDSKEFTSCSAFGGCLKIVRMIMVKMHGPGSTVVMGSLAPAQVHVMAVSHSSFQFAISSSNRSDTTKALALDDNERECQTKITQQLELIRLLICTAALDANNVKVESETLSIILWVYNASTKGVDRLLRRLMYLYDKSDSCEQTIMMNDLRWGPMATKNTSQAISASEENWEWLLDALELERVRLTLSQFPITDTLEPGDHTSIECVKDPDAEMKKDGNQVGSSVDFDEESTSDTGSDTTPLADTHAVSSSFDVMNDLWRGTGNDIRYSPGFILPIILAALEAYQPSEEIKSSEYCKTIGVHPDEELTDKNEDVIAQCQTFGGICRRVCERGGIALAVASLSSRCPSLRKVAVAICGLFLKALQMKESHRIKSWRERPQLEMIMSSIQRGLSVRRAIQIQKHDAQEKIEPRGATANTHRHNVPMLPAVSAIFLAKVLLILSKPADDMYSQMNRYFLRLTDYHGAFQDCFGLPAFLSLYCSSSDELSCCRTERNWALLTLKDGAVDDFCYRIISQHHVPELIMTSFDSLMDDPESKSELYLTIDVIETLLQAGGTRASDHLIKRQGLLSWLHGVVSWREVSSIFPYVALKCRFLKLITTTIDAYKKSTKLASDDGDVEALTFYERLPLANTAIQICLSENDAKDINDDSSHETSTTLLTSTCNALCAIYSAEKGSQITITSPGLTTLNDATSLLKKYVHHAEMFGKVLTSLCDLPLVTGDIDGNCSKLFCELALGFILEMSAQVMPATILLSLKRVNELMKTYPSLGNETKIMLQAMNCRYLAVKAGGIEVWNGFLPHLANISSNTTLLHHRIGCSSSNYSC